MQRLIRKLFTFLLLAAGQGALRRGNVRFQGFPGLPHGLIKIGQADLDPQVIGFRQQKLLQQRHRFRLLVVLQVEFGELQEERSRLAHDPLLHVQVSQLFERTNFFGGEFRDALVNGDGLRQETIADEQLREPLEVIDGLERLALADVQLSDGHQGNLIPRLVLQDLLIFGDGLRHLALIQQLLCGFNEFALVVGHALMGQLPYESRPRLSP